MGHDDGFDVYDADDWSKPNLETRGGHSTNSQFDFRGTTAAVASYDEKTTNGAFTLLKKDEFWRVAATWPAPKRVDAVAFEHRGTYAAFGDRDGWLTVIDSAANDPDPEAPPIYATKLPESPRGACFSHDDAHLAVADATGSVLVLIVERHWAPACSFRAAPRSQLMKCCTFAAWMLCRGDAAAAWIFRGDRRAAAATWDIPRRPTRASGTRGRG